MTDITAKLALMGVDYDHLVGDELVMYCLQETADRTRRQLQ